MCLPYCLTHRETLVWMWKTYIILIKIKHKSKFNRRSPNSGILSDLFDGSQKSDCLVPCKTAHFETKFLNKYSSDYSHIDITFSSEVRGHYKRGRWTIYNIVPLPPFIGENNDNRYAETFSEHLSFHGIKMPFPQSY